MKHMTKVYKSSFSNRPVYLLAARSVNDASFIGFAMTSPRDTTSRQRFFGVWVKIPGSGGGFQKTPKRNRLI